jgi:hypothetical protein
VTGHEFADFLHERILKPLGMTDTIVTRNGMSEAQNMALPYAKLYNGSYMKIKGYDYFDTLSLPTIGVYSSIRDLLIWAKTLLDAQEPSSTPDNNPLREVATIWSPQVNVEPGVDYCFGWYRGYLSKPYVTLQGGNSMFGREQLEKYAAKYVLGRESPPLEVLCHNGGADGYTSAVYIFPETSSAVVALSNSFDLCDAADFAARQAIQSLFELSPRVDLLMLAKIEAAFHKQWFEGMIMQWRNQREIAAREADLSDYVGHYGGLGITINILLREETGRLAFTINSLRSTLSDLELYTKTDKLEAYSFMPLTKDDWLTKALIDWNYYAVGLFYFHRGEDGKVNALSWLYEYTDDYGYFEKVV